jgi:hypothetical protein
MRELLRPMDEDSYLAFERASQEKHELWDGRVYMTSGESLAHNQIVMNLLYGIHQGLESQAAECWPRATSIPT